jgi:hypothetical protein
MGMATEIHRARFVFGDPEIPASRRPIAASGIKPLTSPFKQAYRTEGTTKSGDTGSEPTRFEHHREEKRRHEK